MLNTDLFLLLQQSSNRFPITVFSIVLKCIVLAHFKPCSLYVRTTAYTSSTTFMVVSEHLLHMIWHTELCSCWFWYIFLHDFIKSVRQWSMIPLASLWSMMLTRHVSDLLEDAIPSDLHVCHTITPGRSCVSRHTSSYRGKCHAEAWKPPGTVHRVRLRQASEAQRGLHSCVISPLAINSASGTCDNSLMAVTKDCDA